MAIKSVEYKGELFEISYEMLNPSAQTDFIVLHGWGSNKELMKNAFSPYLQECRHIYIDLPGFGNSNAPIALTTADVAQIITLFLTQIKGKKEIVLGHSFGGKVATLLHPELLVLVASAGVLVPKPLKVQLKIALFKLLKNLGLTQFRSLFVAQDAKILTPEMYETFKTVVNEDFRPHFQAFSNKALLFWGKDDTATPLFTAFEIQKHLGDADISKYEGDHYFFLHNTQDITRKIANTYFSKE